MDGATKVVVGAPAEERCGRQEGPWRRLLSCPLAVTAHRRALAAYRARRLLMEAAMEGGPAHRPLPSIRRLSATLLLDLCPPNADGLVPVAVTVKVATAKYACRGTRVCGHVGGHGLGMEVSAALGC